MGSSFTDDEKRFLLAEMIKVSHIDIRALVEFIESFNAQPDWFSMQLPGGRNMNQCFQAAESMFNAPMQPPPITTLKRKSLSDQAAEQQAAPKRLAMMASPIEPPLTLAQPPAQRNVNIQPRPSPTSSSAAPNGYSVFHSTVSAPANTGPPPATRKRGRPSKADKEAWQARTSGFQHINYAPISPAPIAPAPQPRQVSVTASGPPPVPPAYRVSPGPDNTKPKKKGRPPADSSSKLRQQPGTILDPAPPAGQRSPAISNLMTPPEQQHLQEQAWSATAQDTGRGAPASPAAGGSRVTTAAMSPLRRDTSAPVTNAA
ncbi:hypothetical protein NKR23_g2433 [Pleurostoma richardsiae]|uniref:Uncharacterized protein n=1 Tax=Pleurostoma richardsiae TaxID=41990 RepID=A0AA38S1W3_9PEZI|nr:hypothetical protein NKR23_g2433 [Pleurostoma richardsiae]